jgi:hypothetical protein
MDGLSTQPVVDGAVLCCSQSAISTGQLHRHAAYAVLHMHYHTRHKRACYVAAPAISTKRGVGDEVANELGAEGPKGRAGFECDRQPMPRPSDRLAYSIARWNTTSHEQQSNKRA